MNIVRELLRWLRTKIGRGPQELSTDAFSKRYGLGRCPLAEACSGPVRRIPLIEGLLRDLSLLDKRDSRLMPCRRNEAAGVMIAKALSHEPEFVLDDPTAGGTW